MYYYEDVGVIQCYYWLEKDCTPCGNGLRGGRCLTTTGPGVGDCKTDGTMVRTYGYGVSCTLQCALPVGTDAEATGSKSKPLDEHTMGTVYKCGTKKNGGGGT